jgi:voltage-gated potassium channel
MNRSIRNALYFVLAAIIYLAVVGCLYSIEKGNPDSNIETFSDALWYSVITLTTIGYGDHFPVSDGGRLIALVFVLGSVGILGFVISQISSKIYSIMENKKLGYFGTKFEGHVVIIHWNSFAEQILSEIVNADQKAVVVTSNKADIDFIYNHYDQKKVFVLHSDYVDKAMMENANIEHCNTVLLNFDDDTENLVQLISLKNAFPNLCYVISLNNPSLKSTFQSLGVTFTLSKNEVASKLIASYVFEPEVAKITEGIMSSAVNEDDMGLMQFKILPTNPYVNEKALDLFVRLKQEYNVVLVGISKKQNDSYFLIKNPTNDHKLEANDYAVIMGSPSGRIKITEVFQVSEGI